MIPDYISEQAVRDALVDDDENDAETNAALFLNNLDVQVTYPLSREEFEAGAKRSEPFVVVESEDGDLYAYGHIASAAFAASVRSFDSGRDVSNYDADRGEHSERRWAICTIPADPPDGWWITWHGVDQDTPNAIPITIETVG